MKRAFLVVLALFLAFCAYVWAGIPSRAEVRALAVRNPASTGVMRQRAQEAQEAKRRFKPTQTWIPLSRVSRHLVHAVLSAEDQKFFGHAGVDWAAVQKSFDEDRRKWRFARGGSTITQQLAKNLFFTTHKSPVRKLRELLVATWLEEDLEKRRILEIYLNVIEWGDGVYGVQAASQRYYGKKTAATLSPTEAAGLAAMIPNPRRINPRVDPRRFARAQRRVLWLMAHAGYLSRSSLGAEPPRDVPDKDDDAPPPPEPDAPVEAPPPERASPDAPPSEPAVASPGPAAEPPQDTAPETAPSPSPGVA